MNYSFIQKIVGSSAEQRYATNNEKMFEGANLQLICLLNLKSFIRVNHLTVNWLLNRPRPNLIHNNSNHYERLHQVTISDELLRLQGLLGVRDEEATEGVGSREA